MLFFAFAPSHSLATFETFNHGQCFTIFTSGWLEWYIVLITLSKLKIGIFIHLFSSINGFEFVAKNQIWCTSLRKWLTKIRVWKLSYSYLVETNKKLTPKNRTRQAFLEIRPLILQLIRLILQRMHWYMLTKIMLPQWKVNLQFS